MRKTAFRLEKVTGVVALTYLVVIPVTAFVFHRRITRLDREMVEVLHQLDLPVDTSSPLDIKVPSIQEFGKKIRERIAPPDQS